MQKNRKWLGSVVVSALAAVAPAAFAQEKVPIGIITSLTGPGAYLGQEIRDGFLLAISLEGGKLGGVPVELIVEDDGGKPGQGKQIAERLIKNRQVKLFSGIVFSNVAGATVPEVLDSGAIYVSANAGPSNFAGKNCHKNYFVVSWQNDNLHEAAGEAANKQGYKRAYILAPNYQAGKDALAGFRRTFKGEIIGESYTRLDQTDYAAELAQIRAAKPDMVFQFHPGGLGIAFVRQYHQAGLTSQVPMVVPAASLDNVTVNSVGEPALGVVVTSHWNSDFDNPANKRFVTEWRAMFNRSPTYYASQGFDAALAIAAALKGTNGNVSDTEVFRKEMLKANFASTRGAFKFGTNQHPVQDWYSLAVKKDPKGGYMLETTGKVLTMHTDAYAAECKM
jgi:branched-chain amino acid transport system substrate-binding protein